MTLEARAERARVRMVEGLRRLGTSETTAAAFAAVPRHRLVPRFWSGRAGGPGSLPPSAPWRVEHRVADGDPGTLDLLHELDRALAVNQVPGTLGRATSTASAPRLLAAQADQLALQPGMAVLEIGTGPGYFAAVLAELVGPGGRVVSVDIDAEVAGAAAERLAGCGYGRVVVRTADGHAGAPDLAPFDRVVASVGCTDVAAAWLAQLAPGGRALVPLLHGGAHPQVSVAPDGSGRVVLRSGYVAIQGRQASTSPWPTAGADVGATVAEPLPDGLRAALASAVGDDGARREWDVGFRVALADARAGWMAALDDGAGSSARLDLAAGTLQRGGPCGDALADALRAHLEGWLDDGAPAVEDHDHRFVPLGEPAPEGRWRVRRTDHLQVVRQDAVPPTDQEARMPGQPPPLADERAQLLAFVAQQRDGIRYAAFGLTEDQARATPTAGTLSVGGLVKHAAAMERQWVATALQRQAGVDYEASFRLGPDETLAGALAELEAAGRETEEAMAGVGLDDPVPVPKGVPWFPQDLDAWSVRWVLLHLVEELGRHAGHADIVRESVDGATTYELMAAAEGWPATDWLQPWRPPGG